ncbi:MAG: type II secretion system protein M [Burkholderiales bacterium]|nr:type II secretion system protein M [Burkholderiales bacterium]
MIAMSAIADAWARASVRERRMIAVAGVVVAAALGWTLVWQPAVADIARLERDLPRQRAVLAAARAQADAIVALERTPAPVRTQEPLAAVERVVAERGLRPAVSLLDFSEGRVRITFAAIRFDALPGLVDALAKTAGVRVTDAVVTHRVEPGMVRAELVLVR